MQATNSRPSSSDSGAHPAGRGNSLPLIAGAAGYLEKDEAKAKAGELDRIVATLHVLAHKRR